MTKVQLHSKRIFPKTADEVYKDFYGKITRSIKKNTTISKDEFCGKYYYLSRIYEKENQTDKFTRLSKGLMELLVSKNLDDMAGIVCSLLIKLNSNNPNVAEDLALRGIAIARRKHDPVHIASKACSLNEILRKKEPGSERHVKYLRIENKALKDVCRNYEGDASSRFCTVSSKLASLRNYEIKLCNVKIDIATHTLLADYNAALYEYEQAMLLYKKNKALYDSNPKNFTPNFVNALTIAEKRLKGFERRMEKVLQENTLKH